VKACRNCKNISEETICPVCGGTDFSEDYSGLLIVLDSENSILAEKINAKEPGQYALKIR